jgi:hypothetical protein
VSQEYFVSVLREKYADLDPSERKRKIRELVSESPENAKVIQQLFPEFFREAFPSNGNGAGRHSVSDVSPSLAAKRS